MNNKIIANSQNQQKYTQSQYHKVLNNISGCVTVIKFKWCLIKIKMYFMNPPK